jgi:hypothetical protein
VFDKAKVFLTRQIGPFPIYAYVVGGLALIGGIIYFKRKGNTGSATAAPQTNYPTGDTTPMPYPGGAGSPGIPPTAAFDNGAGTGAYVPQGNYTPPDPSATSSQIFGSAVSNPYQSTAAAIGPANAGTRTFWKSPSYTGTAAAIAPANAGGRRFWQRPIAAVQAAIQGSAAANPYASTGSGAARYGEH